ncbi:MAG: hypothetical protein GXY33_10545 [Phycisphaerae bacterium]|nr:hypothetical protein [Phycisphaerae bacterium]
MTRTAALLALLLLITAGCAEQQTPVPRERGSLAVFETAGPDEVFTAAERAIRGPYDLAEVDRTTQFLRTVPQEFRGREGQERIGDRILPGENLYRKVVTIHVDQTGTGQTVASVRVEVQRFDTPAVRAFAYQRERTDYPAEQSALRDATVDAEQRNVWTTVTRDRQEEERILQEIRALAAPETTQPTES